MRQILEITSIQSPCPGSGCASTWTVAPDGHLTGNTPTKVVDAQLTDDDKIQLRDYVDGLGLRPALRDGLPCMQNQVLDLSVKFDLTLSTGTLSKDVTGCVSDDGLIRSVYALLLKY